MGEKHFHRRYGEMQAANRPSLAYYNADKLPALLHSKGESAFRLLSTYIIVHSYMYCTL